MKSTVEQLSPTRVKINVEVPFDELKPSFDRAYRKIAQQVKIPGFRPGKAPARVLEQRLGRGVVLDEVVNEAVPAKYVEALNSGEVRPLGQPEIEVTKIEDGDHLAFTAEVDVRPDIALPDYDSLSVSVDDAVVSDADIDEQLDQLRARFGTLSGVDRPVENGDFVSIDLSGTLNGEELPEAATTGLSYEVGSGELMEGIDDALVGASEGDERTFTTTLQGGEHAGEEAEVTVRVASVKVRELPDADDEFAQLASEFDTLDELRADLSERLDRTKRMQQGAEARDKVLEALLEATEVPLPESVVTSEYDVRKHDAVHTFDHDEQKLADFLAERGESMDKLETDLRSSAEQAVKTQLVLDSIADAEELSVSDGELSERIVYQAQRYGMSPDDFVKRAQEGGQLGAIYADVRRGKALGLVVRQATVTDASGNPVDIAALFGENEQDAEATGADELPTGGSSTEESATEESATDESATDESATGERQPTATASE